MKASQVEKFLSICTKETSVRTLTVFLLVAEFQLTDGGVFQDRLTEYLTISKSATQRCIRQLVELNLLCSEKPEGAKHRREITLTAKGEQLYRSLLS